MLDIDGAASGEEIEAGIRGTRAETRKWKGRTGWALLSFAVSCGFVVLISDIGPFHAEAKMFGLATVVVWLGLLLVLVYCGAMWWSLWAALRDLERTYR